MKKFLYVAFLLCVSVTQAADGLTPTRLRVEYRENPLGIDTTTPRLSWQVASDERGQKQTAYRIGVSSSQEKLNANDFDRWDTGKIDSDETLFIPYLGKALQSRQPCFWKVFTWDVRGDVSVSEPASWSMGLLADADWSADYISYRDASSIHTDTKTLYLPAARQYRKEFAAKREVKRATVYATALGIYELHLNGQKVGDAYFAPGWTDYRQRAYYNTYDVTDLVDGGANAIGAWVAEGWYSGYVGFGLLTGMGTEKCGRANYGKTPAFMAQLEIEYTDGSRDVIGTDASWKVTADGPIQEADLLMGESYDAQREIADWAEPGCDDSGWDNAILATDNGSTVADFYQARNPSKPGQGPRIVGEPRELGFQRPKLESFPGEPVLVTEEIAAKTITQREAGTYVFDLGQNFAGVIRLKVQGPAGQKITIRHGETLHPDGRLMTENLRKARAIDTYVCKGDPDGETYEPRFTFHGFQYVELSNFPGEPSLDTVTGLVMHSDTPMTSEFACSDPMVNQLFQNVLWTQRSNFLDLPTDCPQRDERMGWTGDAQAYVGTAAYNADIGAFYTKWLRELMESQRPSGAFPGYAPFPFQHGWDFGSAWADAGVICPWTIWQAYGDTRVIDDCWEPMVRFMEWHERTSVQNLGVTHGNAWGDWLAQGASTPLDYIDTVYKAISARMMAEMAEETGRDAAARKYSDQLKRTTEAFNAKYVDDDGRVNIPTQTAQALALFADLIPQPKRENTGAYLAELIAENGNHMATGFLGTRPLLPVLSESGQHDLAVFLLQSREFPSWGYEIENGATTIWERWDSYTREDAFGRHNAAMNSFSHYAFGAVCEWMFNTLAGIRSSGPGYHRIVIAPEPPSPDSNALHEPIDWVNAEYESIRGTIKSSWKLVDGTVLLSVTIPANTTAEVHIPTGDAEAIRETTNGAARPLSNVAHATLLRSDEREAVVEIQSGSYVFTVASSVTPAAKPITTSKPKDNSINPEKIDLTGAEKLIEWDFTNVADVARWDQRSSCEVQQRDGDTYLVAAGQDSQIATRFDAPVRGRLAIVLKANPGKGAESEFFWAGPGGGYNPTWSSKRRLQETDQVNEYVFGVDAGSPIDKLRFDPFATYDQYAKPSEMKIESIAIYRLARAQANAQVGRPNIVMVFVDDWGYGDLGVYGHLTDVQTPHLDRLAANGVLFTDAYVTAPQCSPSRAGLMTGRYQQRFGFDTIPDCPLPLEETTVATLLSDAGYTTGFVGKWHLDPNAVSVRWAKANQPDGVIGNRVQVRQDLAKPYWPQNRGFAEFFAGELSSYWCNFGLDGRTLKPDGQRIRERRFRVDVQADAAVAFIERRSEDDSPFFLYFAPYAPHVPLEATDEYLSRFSTDMPARRRTGLAMMAAVDEAVGRIVAQLRQQGLADNTLVMFTSDNGAPLGAHTSQIMDDVLPVDKPGPAWDGSRNDPLTGEKGMLAEGGVRVPMVWAWSTKIPAGQVVTEPVSALDMTATALATAGVTSTPKPLDGVNLLPQLKGDAGPAERELYWRFWNQAAVRGGDFKLIHVSGREPMLFDVRNDVAEANDLASAKPAVTSRLLASLTDWTNQLAPPGLPSRPINDQERKWFRYYFDSPRSVTN